MGSYNDYLDQLKGIPAGLDAEKMRRRLDARIAGQAARKKHILEGTLALLLLITAAYFNFRPSFSGNNELVADYVYQQGDLNGDQIINYVFTE